MRARVYTAVIRDEQVLMVRHVHDGHDYWTLPGGGVEEGEAPIDAARREVIEETGIVVQGLRKLFTDGSETCFVAGCSREQIAVVGYDPELLGREQWIHQVRWFTLAEKADDIQVRGVLRHLGGGDGDG